MRRTPLQRQKMPRSAVLKRKTVKATTKKKKSVKSRKTKLDAIFSKFIRERDNHTCYTCDVVMDPKKSQNGHFVPRQYLATRYDEVNNHAQCYACNVLYNGQPSAYAKRLKEDYGADIVEVLEGKRKISIKNFDYEYWTEIYEEKYRDILRKPNL